MIDTDLFLILMFLSLLPYFPQHHRLSMISDLWKQITVYLKDKSRSCFIQQQTGVILHMVNKISLIKALINIIDNHMNPTIDTVSMVLASIDCTIMCHFQ